MTDSLFPRFSDSEYTRRFNAIRAAMSQGNLDAILVSGARGSSEVAYLSNYQAQSPCWLLFPRDGDATVFIHFFNHQPCAKAQSIMDDVRWYGPTPMPTLIEEIKRRGLSESKIGLVSMRSMAYGNVMELQRQLPEAIAAHIPDHAHSFAKLRHLRSKNVCRSAQINCVIAHNFFDLVELRTHIAGNHQINAHVRYGQDI